VSILDKSTSILEIRYELNKFSKTKENAETNTTNNDVGVRGTGWEGFGNFEKWLHMVTGGGEG
jgi:hypothetical protein